MNHYFQPYYDQMVKCKAYKCQEYCSFGSDKYCFLHHQEMIKLNSSSDDFNSKIKNIEPRSTDTCCRSTGCNEIYNLVEDYISTNNEITYIKLCIPHHNELLKKREYDRFSEKVYNKTCDYNNCRNSLDLDKFKNKLFCPLHYYKVSKVNIPKITCNIDGCKKTARLIKSLDKFWCKKHFNEQPNPEIFKSNEPKKYEWLENYKGHIKDNININDKDKDKDKDNINDKDKDKDKGHIKDNINININDNDKDKDKDKDNIKNVKDKDNIKDKLYIKYTNIIKKIDKNNDEIETKCTDIVKTPDVIPDIYDLLNKCKNTGKIQMSNQVCEAYDCKIYKQLYEKYQGHFCCNHISEISELRNIINKHDGSKQELIARLKELRLRKFPDLNHWKFTYELWRHYQKYS